jgi:hypothetical protein
VPVAASRSREAVHAVRTSVLRRPVPFLAGSPESRRNSESLCPPLAVDRGGWGPDPGGDSLGGAGRCSVLRLQLVAGRGAKRPGHRTPLRVGRGRDRPHRAKSEGGKYFRRRDEPLGRNWEILPLIGTQIGQIGLNPAQSLKSIESV